MKQNHALDVIIYAPSLCAARRIATCVSAFHAGVIRRRLNQADLRVKDKLAVIDKIINNLKSKAVDGNIM